MQEAVYEIGKLVVSKASDPLIPHIKKIKNSKNKNGDSLNIFKINFDMNKDVIIFSIEEEYSDFSSKDYLFVGRIGGPNSKQFILSDNKFDYFISESIPNLLNKLEDEEKRNLFQEVLNKFYLEKDGSYFLNIEKIEENKEKIDNENLNLKYVKDYITKYVKKRFDCKLKDDFALFVLCINDEPVCKEDFYRELLINNLISSTDKSKKSLKNVDKGCCNMCGSESNLINNSSKFPIKYYITDKITFASDFKSENFRKNFQFCAECENILVSGQNYIKEKLSSKISNFSVYLVPHFIFDQPNDLKKLEKLITKLSSSFSTVVNLKEIKVLKENLAALKEVMSLERYAFTLDIIFYKMSNAATKFIKVIKDLNPSIFDKFEAAYYDVYDLFNRNNLSNKNFSINHIPYLLPIKKDSSGFANYNYILMIYNNLFQQLKIDKKVLIKKFLETLNVIYYEKYGYTVSDDKDLKIKVIEQLKFIKFCEFLNCFEKEEAMITDDLKLNDKFISFIKEMNYTEQQTAMFLLGYLIGEIGKKQNSNNQKKPILNKLSFKGADKQKLIKLSVMIMNKLKQEKILQYNEIIYSQFKFLFDKNLNVWNLSNYENEFYILSGYSYSSALNYNKQNESKGEEENGNKE
jgi:CRISPR-associated protein Csh1